MSNTPIFLGISSSVNITTNHVKFYFFDNDDMKPSKLQVSFKSLIYIITKDNLDF